MKKRLSFAYDKALEEVYFIPVKDGTYEFVCTIEGHMEKGMRGKITIENKKAEPGQIRYY
jgi:plastocyanin